jgi:hypothetical protein
MAAFWLLFPLPGRFVPPVLPVAVLFLIVWQLFGFESFLHNLQHMRSLDTEPFMKRKEACLGNTNGVENVIHVVLL